MYEENVSVFTLISILSVIVFSQQILKTTNQTTITQTLKFPFRRTRSHRQPPKNNNRITLTHFYAEQYDANLRNIICSASVTKLVFFCEFRSSDGVSWKMRQGRNFWTILLWVAHIHDSRLRNYSCENEKMREFLLSWSEV